MRTTICICYAQEDESFLKKLITYLKPLQREKVIDLWYDLKIRAGEEREQEITTHLDTAQLILLLISPSFIASDYCYGREMKRAIERHRQGNARVVPIVLRPTDWSNTPLEELQALPENGNAITSKKWINRDDAFYSVFNGLKKVIADINPNIASLSQELTEDSSQNRNVLSANISSKLLESLSHKRLCPVCIEEFYPGECRIISRETREELKAAPTRWLERHFARSHPESLSHPNYLRKSACRECPNCGYLFPSNFDESENLSIAILGDVASGKTHYIASVIACLRGLHLKENPISFISADEKTGERYFRDYYTPIFRQREVLSPTLPATSFNPYYYPLVYEMIPSKWHGTGLKRKNLMLYDGAGEDYIQSERMMEYARYVLYASGIILLLDPLALSDVAEHVPPRLRKPSFQEYRPYDVLQSIIQIFDVYYGSEARNRLKLMPLAITVSKSDLLQYSPLIKSQSYSFLNSSTDKNIFNLREMETIRREVRDFLSLYGDNRRLIEITRFFPQVGFFAVSSTGCSPDEHGQYPFIEPIRCTDPVLWILRTLGCY